MADDPIQALLEEWQRAPRQQTPLRAAFERLRDELKGPVARYLHRPVDGAEVDECLSELLSALLVSAQPGARPRALAPPGHPSPLAWRKVVLRNALHDRGRRRGSWQRRSAAAVEAQSLGPPTEEPDTAGLRQLRLDLCRILPRLPVNRRVALALDLDITVPLAWSEELARHLGEPLTALLPLVEAADAEPADEARRVAVLYPPPPPSPQDQAAYRRLVARARDEAKALVHGGQE